MKRGFTLIEIIVALVLFQVGMLALAATSVVASRDLADAHRHARALALARNRVELLRAQECPVAATGQTSSAGLVETWLVAVDGRRRVISDSVDFRLSRGRSGNVVLRMAMLCAS